MYIWYVLSSQRPTEDSMAPPFSDEEADPEELRDLAQSPASNDWQARCAPECMVLLHVFGQGALTECLLAPEVPRPGPRRICLPSPMLD
jgi:hypothetical protein